MKLTENEKMVLIALVQNGMDTNGTKSPKELLQDNMTWFNRQDISDFLGFSRHKAAGVMSSMARKGLLQNYDPKQKHGWIVTNNGLEIAEKIFNPGSPNGIEETSEETVVAA